MSKYKAAVQKNKNSKNGNSHNKVLNDTKLAHDMKLINDVYTRVLKMGKKLYLGSDNNTTVKTAQNLESYVGYLDNLNEKLTTIRNLTEKFSEQCLEKAVEIREQIHEENKYIGDPSRMFMAYGSRYRNMSWANINSMEETNDKTLKSIEDMSVNTPEKKDYAYMPVLYKNISTMYGVELGGNFKVPIVNRITDMPAALYWYKGDARYPPGVYICISRGFYVQVPFPNVVDSTKDFNRIGSVKCKYNTTKECHAIRHTMAQKYKSDVRVCNFAHSGDRYTKIGTSFRCASTPRFGNHNHLKTDTRKIDTADMNNILMYSLSDLLLSSIWAQTHARNGILTNIDIC